MLKLALLTMPLSRNGEIKFLTMLFFSNAEIEFIDHAPF
jgi:hypothetical protein